MVVDSVKSDFSILSYDLKNRTKLNKNSGMMCKHGNMVTVLLLLLFRLDTGSSFDGSMVEYEGSRVPDCLNFVNPETREPYYHSHSWSKILRVTR